MVDAADIAVAFARSMGDSRTERQMAEDGAKRCLSQIDKLRNQLRMCERDCQHLLATGNALKDSDAIWKRALKAADKLFDGLPA